jgi:hypothetical protein
VGSEKKVAPKEIATPIKWKNEKQQPKAKNAQLKVIT